jgi:hypothetical protein
LVSLAAPAGATYVDSVASISFEHYPDAANGDGLGTTRLEVFRAWVGVPVRVGKRTLLFAGSAYETIHVKHSAYESFQLHAPRLSLGLIQGFTDKWGVFVLTDFGLASDFSGSVGNNDILFSVIALATYKVTNAFELGAGALYDRRTGSFIPLPGLSLDVRIYERMRIRGFAPVWLNAEFRVAEWLDVGVRSTFEGNRFHLAKTFVQPNVELAYSTLTVGPKLTFNFLDDWLHLDTYAAWAVYRRYELFHDDRSIANYDLSPVVAYGARLWLAPSGW